MPTSNKEYPLPFHQIQPAKIDVNPTPSRSHFKFKCYLTLLSINIAIILLDIDLGFINEIYIMWEETIEFSLLFIYIWL